MINYFSQPHYLWLLLIIPIYIYWDIFRKKKVSLYYSGSFLIKKALDRNRFSPLIILTILKIIILSLLIIALARPQLRSENKEIFRKGVDIVIALDSSGSMAAEDLKPDRLTISKKIIQNFIKKRMNDRLGLVVFGGFAITKTPLTFDHNMLANIVETTDFGDAGDGTAIGQAIVTALNRLRDSGAKSKVIILLTDGENNSGQITPLDAAKLAQDLGVKIYTVGIGNPAGAPIPYVHPQFGKQYLRNPDGSYALTKLDIITLTKIAETTKAKFYKAPTANDLRNVFKDIDKLEKVKLKSDVSYNSKDRFVYFIIVALILLIIEFVLSKTLLRSHPCI